MDSLPPDVINDIVTYDFHATEEYEIFRKVLRLRRFNAGIIFLQYNCTIINKVIMFKVMFYSNIILALWYGSVLTTAVKHSSFRSFYTDAKAFTEYDKTGKYRSSVEMWRQAKIMCSITLTISHRVPPRGVCGHGVKYSPLSVTCSRVMS